MACEECAERRRMARDALLRSATGEAAAHLIKGAAELTGLKRKTKRKPARRERDRSD